MAQLAWIGLGNMGRGMCKNLVEKGNLDKPLILYNRTTARAEKLKADIGNAAVATTIADAVKPADIIFTCVGDDKAIEETIDAALKEDVKGKLFVECSTVHPDTTEAVAKRITAAGGHFVASPVFGAPAMADAGQLVCVYAGPAQDVEKARRYGKGVVARAEINFSDQPYSTALKLKILGNTFVAQMVEALAEGHTAAEKIGLGVENLHQFIEVLFPGPYVAYSKRMLGGDYYARQEPLFAVDLALKDVRHALDLAEGSGAKMKAVEVAQEHLKTVKAERGTTGDFAGIYGVVREEAGLPFDNGKAQ